jgi:hypothetical protein
MAHYAFLNNNIVTEVIVGIDETELIEGLTPEEWYGNFRKQPCVRTSYNGNIRKQYAGIGYTYDPVNDVFIAPQPYGSWTLMKTLIGNHQPRCQQKKAKCMRGLNQTNNG